MEESTYTGTGFSDPFASAEKDSLTGFRGDLEFTEILGGFTEAKPMPVSIDPRKIGMVIFATLLIGLIFVGYKYGMPYFGSSLGDPVAVEEVRPGAESAITTAPGLVTQVEEEGLSASDDSFGFVTTLAKPSYTKNRKITATEELLWTAELSHPYTFRRFKVIYEARRALYAGSDAFLTQGLEQNKFWTRMQAVFALAEMGANVSAEHVQRAIGDARPYLLKNYFKRFKKTSTEGERYVMSLAMFFVDSEAQSVIADVLTPYQESVN